MKTEENQNEFQDLIGKSLEAGKNWLEANRPSTPQPTAEGQRLSAEKLLNSYVAPLFVFTAYTIENVASFRERVLKAMEAYAAQLHNKGEKSMFKLPDYDKGYTDGVGDMKRDIAEGKWNKTREKVIHKGETNNQNITAHVVKEASKIVSKDLMPSKVFSQQGECEREKWSPTSQEIIGNVKTRYEQLKGKEFDWRSFYHGWLEGRANLVRERNTLTKANERPVIPPRPPQQP